MSYRVSLFLYDLCAFSLGELGLLRKDLYNIFFFRVDLARPLVNQGLRRLSHFALMETFIVN